MSSSFLQILPSYHQIERNRFVMLWSLRTTPGTQHQSATNKIHESWYHLQKDKTLAWIFLVAIRVSIQYQGIFHLEPNIIRLFPFCGSHSHWITGCNLAKCYKLVNGIFSLQMQFENLMTYLFHRGIGIVFFVFLFLF